MILLFAAAWAEEVVLTSLEHAVDSADVVVEVTLEPAGPGEVRLVIVEVLHSDVAATVPATLRCADCTPGRHLLGLGASEDHMLIAAHGGPWWISWDFGGAHHGRGIDGAELLAAGPILTDPAAIRAAVVARLDRPPTPGPRNSLWLDLTDGEVHQRTWAGSGVHLTVPPDPQHLPMVLGWARSTDPWLQQRAASALRSYPGKGTAELRAMLTTPPLQMSGPGGVWMGWVWPAREAAWLTLGLRGELGLRAEPEEMGWVTVESRKLDVQPAQNSR